MLHRKFISVYHIETNDNLHRLCNEILARLSCNLHQGGVHSDHSSGFLRHCKRY